MTEREDREKALGDLHEVTQKFMRATSPEEVATLAVEAGREVLGLPYTHFYVISDDGQKLIPHATAKKVDDRFGDLPTFPRGEGLLWTAVEAGDIQQYDDVQEEEGLASDMPFRGAFISPVGEYGVFGSGSLEPRKFDAFDRELASILIAQMEAALDAVKRQEALRAHEEKLQRQNERLEEFAGVVSHDLRNPLNVAEGRIEVAKEECESEHLDLAEEALNRMGKLIDRTLTLARTGQAVGETEPVNLSTLTEPCWRNVDTADSTLQSEEIPEIEADRERLQHLFENLYRNAVEHGGKDVTVTVGKLDDGFYIEDDGKGLSAEKQGDIFETGYTTNDEGTGLGLSIVKQIVEAHDWDIRVTPGSEGGARFEITGVDFTAA
jgi:signal transduction histidine kinase